MIAHHKLREFQLTVCTPLGGVHSSRLLLLPQVPVRKEMMAADRIVPP